MLNLGIEIHVAGMPINQNLTTISAVYPSECKAVPGVKDFSFLGPHRVSYTPGNPHTNTLVSGEGGKPCR